MSNNIAIKVENLTKIYKLYDKPVDRLKESIHPNKKKYHKDFYAINNVSFEIEKGETVGIIGKNGSGKSTLLKMITGVLTPTSGQIQVNGRISALLELGAGFNPEYTGIENIYLNGTIMGFSKEEMDERLEDILSFADIGDFVYQPVKSYSSGMFARLAFAVAINVEPDILIIDESLSVGDAVFNAKSMEKIREWVNTRTVILVSHSLEAIRSYCKKAILLNKGQIHTIGDVQRVTEVYERLVNQDIVSSKLTSLTKIVEKEKNNVHTGVVEQRPTSFTEDVEFTKRVQMFRSGTGQAKFIRAEALVDGEPTHSIPFGKEAVFRLLVEYYQDIDTEGTVGYMVRNRNGQDVFGMNVYCLERFIPPMKMGQLLEVEFSFKNVLAPGSYSVSLGLKPKPIEPLFLDNVHTAIVFEVPPLEGQNYVPGLLYVPNELQMNVIDVQKYDLIRGKLCRT